ncbi:hypothetical protein ACOSOMT5_P0052 [Acidiphilium sp. MT5]
MSQKMIVYRVFVSSPTDVVAERQAAKSAILETSSFFEKNGIRLEPWLWEENAVSEFGNKPQEIITQQLGEYDLYIGIMGATFGSPTQKYGSGTEEEFNGAIGALQAGTLRHASFFFKDVTFQAKHIDNNQILQLQKIAEYKERISTSGLYQYFIDEKDLKEKIKQILIREFTKKNSEDLNNEYLVSSYQISTVFESEVLNSLDKNLISGDSWISLEDIWIDLDIIVEERDAAGKLKRLSSNISRICDEAMSGNSIHIVGGETSGKSTACKKLFRILHAGNFFPVLLSSKKIKSANVDDLSNKIAQCISEQYLGFSQKQAKKIDSKKIIIIIDDFDQITLSKKYALKILGWLKDSYYSVIITTATSYKFSVLENTADIAILREFFQSEISELGHKKRYELIENWCKAKKYDDLSNDQFRHAVESKRTVINRILTTHIVPRTPLIVLILLQAIDSGQSADLAHSGYVRYYKFLIDSAILKNLKVAEAEQAYALLPEVAWAIYNSSSMELTADEVECVVDQFASRRALRKSGLFAILEKMRQIGIFEVGQDIYRIRHTYVYNFFLSEYISRNLNQQVMADHVRDLCLNAWSRQTANILIFLSFHTDSMIVIDSLIKNLSEAYVAAPQFEFSIENTEVINRLIEQIPNQILDETKTKERRNNRFDTHDRIDASERSAMEAGPNVMLDEMDRVFVAVEIIGHILRNHYARIDAEPKQNMLEVASNAILRCIGSLLDKLSKSIDTVVDMIQTALYHIEIKQNPEYKDKNNDIREKIARQIVFILTAGFISYCSRKLSRAVGDENLDITYQQVLEKVPNSMKKYLDVIIKLDCYRSFPLKELDEVANLLKKDHVGTSVLRYAVAERLDMRPPENSADFKRYCDLVGLEITPRLIERQRLGSHTK